MRRSPRILVAALLFAAAFAVLWCAVAFQATDAVDRASLAPNLGDKHAIVQIAEALGVTLWPGVIYAIVAGMAWWAWERRLRNLALANLVAIGLGWSLTLLVKYTLQRPRPIPVVSDMITAAGPAFPSSHVIAATIGAWMVLANMISTRQRQPVVRWAIAWSTLVLALTVVSRWLLRAHWVSDTVGGLLLGSAVGAFALWSANVHILDLARRPRKAGHKRVAVIVNPSKVLDVASFRRHVEYEVKVRGWQAPLWLETTVEENGAGLAEQAANEGVHLVIVAGGDGTTRVVCGKLANTGIPVALAPAGTTNLLARNLSLPLDESAALAVAFDGRPEKFDIVAFTPDADPSRVEYSAVIGGIGLDGSTFANTNDVLKQAIGPAAYAVAAAQQYTRGSGTMTATVTTDENTFETQAAMISIGNVGLLPGGFEVIPGAKPDDGLLNVVIATAENLLGWAQTFGDILARRTDISGFSETLSSKVRIELDAPHPWQLDGDALGECQLLEAEVLAGALIVMRPRA